jgi:hypothetical protein
MMEAAKELAGPAWKGEEGFGGGGMGQEETEHNSGAVAQGSGAQADGQDLPSELSASQERSNIQDGPAPIGTAAAGTSKAAQGTAVIWVVKGDQKPKQMTVAAPSSSTAGGLKRKR